MSKFVESVSMSERLTMFLGVLLLPLLAIGQAASEVPVTSVSTALPGSPTWSATAPFNTLVTRDMDPITGQLGAAVPRNFTHNISAFGSGGANQYAEPVGSYTYSLTPANSDITVVGTFSLGRHYRIDFTIPEQAFPTAIALAGAGVGIGIIFGNYLSGAMRNPSAAQKQFPNLLLGFALAEATGLFGLVVALIILFAF